MPTGEKRKKGDPGLPGAGRKKGSKSGPVTKKTLIFNELRNEGMERLIEKIYDMAYKGDPEKTSTISAMTYLLDRVKPPGAYLSITLPPIFKLDDVYQTLISTVNAVLKKNLTPTEGKQVLDILEKTRVFLKEAELVDRLTVMEHKMEEIDEVKERLIAWEEASSGK